MISNLMNIRLHNVKSSKPIDIYHDLDILSHSFQCYLNVLFRNKHQYSNFVVAPNTGVQNQG